MPTEEYQSAKLRRSVHRSEILSSKKFKLKTKSIQMKKATLLLMAITATMLSFAQSAKYVEAMKANLTLLDSAKTTADFNAATASFERIGNAEKTVWLPYYYAALAQIRMAFTDQSADKYVLAKKINEFILKGEAINKNAEFYTLRYMNATLQLMVNPMERWQTFGAEAETAFQKGVKMDANNPRLYYLKGLSVLNTPEQFGGGINNARPLFEKVIALAKNANNTDALLPTWGGEEAQQVLKQIDGK